MEYYKYNLNVTKRMQKQLKTSINSWAYNENCFKSQKMAKTVKMCLKYTKYGQVYQ